MDEEEDDKEEEEEEGNEVVEGLGTALFEELIAGLGAGVGVAGIPVPAAPVTATVVLCTWTGLV